MKLRVAFAVAAACFALSASAGSQIQIHNQSSWTINELYLSPTSVEEWGPDQLGENVVEPGQYVDFSSVPCGDYDIRLVDEDGDVCIVRDVRLCDDAAYTLDDDDLLDCEANTDE